MEQERFGGNAGAGTMTRTVELIDTAIEQLGTEFSVTDAVWVSEVRDHLNAAVTLISENADAGDAAG